MKRHYAAFGAPRGELNPLGVNVPGVFHVELYNTRVGVLARSVATGVALPIRGADIHAAMRAVESLYGEQLEPWRIAEIEPPAIRLPRKAPAQPRRRAARGVAS